MALPAHADAGKIFDFNLTLPIMAGQFLLLMVFLDKFWFGPVGKVLDERDGYIRDQLKKFKASHSQECQSSAYIMISSPGVLLSSLCMIWVCSHCIRLRTPNIVALLSFNPVPSCKCVSHFMLSDSPWGVRIT